MTGEALQLSRDQAKISKNPQTSFQRSASEELQFCFINTSPLQRTSLLVPITALAFLSSSTPTLLVAEDNLLKAYDTSTHTLRLTLRVFHAQTIHGIVISDDLILLWGNQSVTALPTSALEAALTGRGEPPAPLAEVKAHDWLFSAAVSPAGRIAFVTAHNEILEATYDAAAQKLVLGRIVAPARPGLYAAKAAWTAPSTLLVAGGTAFGEIVVWTCELPGTGTPSCEVLSVFAGHEGSIFGVDISPEFEVAEGPPGEKMRLLASCSDDRTIRLWDVSAASLERGVVQASFGEARETGFGSVDLSAVADASSAPVAVAMGHGSRIWHVKFAAHDLGFEKGQVVMPVYSFGEDATVHKWRLEVDVAAWQERRASADAVDGGAGKLILRETFAHHDGKHIWAAVVEPLKQGGSLIATGRRGSESQPHHRRCRHDSEREGSNGLDTLPSELSQLVFEDILSLLPPSTQEYPPPSRKRPEGFQNFVFISQDTLLAASTRGRILLGTFAADLAWEEVSYEGQHGRDLAYCTTIRSPAPGVAILGTATKKLFLYKDSTVKEITVMNGKVSDIFVVKSLSDDSPSVVELLIMMIGGPDVMQLLTVDLSSVTVTSSLSVPGQQAGYVATAAHLVGDVLLIGSRHDISRVDGAELEIGTAATDGHLGVWIAQRGGTDVAGEYALQTTARLHQSSVKALDMINLDHDGAEIRLILTGGDDNGLGMTVLQRRHGKYEFVSKTGVKGAHAAAINGLAILQTMPPSPEEQARRTTFATVSNDQRVKVWSLRWGLTEDDEAQLTLLANENSGVADPGDLDVLDGAEEKDYREIVVVGVGMETWRFDLAGKGTLRR
ncbi:conserved hypothetical protein [Verticillium alfalfae VaMs.102]|uniref:Uncharacterized protein n=1 Tax=Verticillium alfalfae (strain VaMs.102 / ATCC MYA-4576 / FGSC 10136) TaxID=526221 RepID=C9SQW5_VERA1|nr:conserved hypothetical protein [Verticillium alfalfae VaMs.102]EEY21240.1 conserved hypothetical protein [Verticillium alfalfae VaMs.102]